jgi:predicted nucleotidyltransferase component of viral defense system
MIYIRPEDTIHKSHLNRLLIEDYRPALSVAKPCFKGGTCAAMLGYLDRFSVDLDFDMSAKRRREGLKDELHLYLTYLDLKVTGELNRALFFQLRYPADPGNAIP